MDLGGETYKWFENYLKDRKQYVYIDGIKSSVMNVGCGVPQGSVLGPILFLVYINDMPSSNNMFTSLFADDTGLFISSPNLNDLIISANMELNNVSEWFSANKLSSNI